MKIAVVSFTKKGAELCKKISTYLNCSGYTLERYASELNLNTLNEGLSKWTQDNFNKCNALIFIGACGIAVRSIAPYIKSKTLDPCVIVIDEMGNYIIPILSGHIGGGNELALRLGKITGGHAIISTATDINNKFAVDVFARKNNLYISNMKIAKEISSKVLDGEKIGLLSDFKIKGDLPNDLTLDFSNVGVFIGLNENHKPYKTTLNLIPKIVSLGIGCRAGTNIENIENLVFKTLLENNISKNSIEGIYSINLKENEKGLIDFSESLGVPFKTFTREELNSVKGDFTKSNFVKSITGVDNVCERAAVLGSCGKLIIKKLSENGVTFAVAIKRWEISFEN